VRVAVALFYLSAMVHAWIGMRSVFMDYLKPSWLRFAATALLGMGMLAMVLWMGDVLLWRAA
jgi:succinate dehydrogenase / fumarate reductase membrane anchor subunit